MSTLGSDFPRSIERIGEGRCPLCDEALREVPNASIVADETWPTNATPLSCEHCELAWAVQLVDAKWALRTSRPLNSDEIRKLYSRG